MALQFSRDVQVILEDPTANYRWEIPVLDGYSFSQAINSSEITVNEAGFESRRARLLFNDALAPVEWSFSTYARPQQVTISGPTTQIRPVEEALWALWAGADSFDGTDSSFKNTGISPDVAVVSYNGTTDTTYNLNGSNISSFAAGWKLFFQFRPTGGTAQVYEVNDIVVNSVTMDFDIDGIATLQWSGFGKQVVDRIAVTKEPTEGFDLTDSASFIRNRLSTLNFQRTDASPDVTYNIILTGGSINFENNINYLTPEELGKVNQPIANITGTRSISGNVTCYLDTGANLSGQMFNDLVSDTTTVRNTFDMAINVGGTGTPSVSFDMTYAHLEIPVVNVEDLLTLDIAFHGQPQSGNVDNTNEATIIYRAA